MGSRSGEAVPVKGLPALYLSVVAPLLVQSSSATLPNLLPPLWSSHLASAHERNALTTVVVGSLSKDSKKGGGFSGTALGHRPQNRAKGADPRTGTPPRRNVFLPWCPVSSLSWPACAGAFLVPGRWFSSPAPSGSCLFLFRLLFLSTGRGRHVPAPRAQREGRRVKRRGTDPRTGPF